jgi:hypothetical protein
MSAPNVVNVATITAKTVQVAVGTSATALLSNAASSSKVFKVNMLIITNIDGSSAADVTVNLYPQDDIGGTGVAIASTISVPADSALIVLDKSTAIYLEEDKSLGGIASAAGDLVATISYEEIS